MIQFPFPWMSYLDYNTYYVDLFIQVITFSMKVQSNCLLFGSHKKTYFLETNYHCIIFWNHWDFRQFLISSNSLKSYRHIWPIYSTIEFEKFNPTSVVEGELYQHIRWAHSHITKSMRRGHIKACFSSSALLCHVYRELQCDEF